METYIAEKAAQLKFFHLLHLELDLSQNTYSWLSLLKVF